jgi:hypothetical protein
MVLFAKLVSTAAMTAIPTAIERRYFIVQSFCLCVGDAARLCGCPSEPDIETTRGAEPNGIRTPSQEACRYLWNWRHLVRRANKAHAVGVTRPSVSREQSKLSRWTVGGRVGTPYDVARPPSGWAHFLRMTGQAEPRASTMHHHGDWRTRAGEHTAQHPTS